MEEASLSRGKRVSFLNKFSAAMGDTALLLEDAPDRRQHSPGIDIRALHHVVTTANSLKSLQANLVSLLRYLDDNPDISLPTLSYTTTARRIHHQFIASLMGSEIISIQKCSRMPTGERGRCACHSICEKTTSYGIHVHWSRKALYWSWTVDP